jgi:hypothetical protein
MGGEEAVNGPVRFFLDFLAKTMLFNGSRNTRRPVPISSLTTRAGHGFPKSHRRFTAPLRIRLDVASLVENDDQNAPPAEQRDERLTAPLLRLLPGGRRGFIRLALQGLEGRKGE